MSVQEFEIPHQDSCRAFDAEHFFGSVQGACQILVSLTFLTQELDMTNFTSDSQAMRIQSALQQKSQKVLKDVEINADNVYMRNKKFKLKESSFFDRLIKLVTTKLF
jgi:hypothetical protein|tara:strand:+ start:258 stop:578 length:321 start_codon:yes stop_codon:yes gene_type:complete